MPVCRELPQLALLSTPTSEGWVPGLGLTMGEVDSLAQVVGMVGCLGPEMRLREQRSTVPAQLPGHGVGVLAVPWHLQDEF